MPGRKSNVSTASNGPEDPAESTPAKQTKERDGLSVEDLSLPKSMIARLAKGVLPANTQIQRDALLALHKSATVFVSYIASNANDNAQAAGKKTILPQDVIAALKDAELEPFLPRLEAELKKYNDVQCDKRNTYRRKVKEEKAAAEAKNGDGADERQDGETNGELNRSTTNGHVDGTESERPAKKLKAENGGAVAPDEAGDEDAEDDQDADEPDDAEDDVDEEIVEDEEDDGDDDGGHDETMEDALEEQEHQSEDEALDDPDSD